MNKNIKLAVAGAILATAATAANAGIIIPAGEWTLDVSGNVNSYAIWTHGSGAATVNGGLATGKASTQASQSTGLLPNFLSVAGSSRQNDLDVTWLISINPGGYTPTAANGGSTNENRQAFMTFGDKSWGSIKIGKDLGIYASNAYSADIGANLKVAGFDLTGYYYGGEGTGATTLFGDGYSKNGFKRSVDGGYVQAKYTLPIKTVVGISWGQSNLDRAGNDLVGDNLLKTNEMWTAGIYHPLTKSVNLVAEFSNVKSTNQANGENTQNVGSLGGILFF